MKQKNYTGRVGWLVSLMSPAMGHWGTCPPQFPTILFVD